MGHTEVVSNFFTIELHSIQTIIINILFIFCFKNKKFSHKNKIS